MAELSLGLHFLLYLSYFFDLLYGFSSHLPWQYKAVSIVGLSLVGIQHWQMMRFRMRVLGHSFGLRSLLFSPNGTIFLLILTFLFLAYFFCKAKTPLPPPYIVLLGAIARISGLLYTVPQIIKNKLTHTSHALSVYFIYLNLILTILDTISAWCLDWGWPNKVAAPISMMLMLTLIRQSRQC